MKKSLSIYSLCAFMVWMIGHMFKVLHWPGASMTLMAGTLLVIIAIILLACHFSKNTNAPKFALWLGALATAVLFVWILWRILLWPGGGYLILINTLLWFIEFIILLIYIIKK